MQHASENVSPIEERITELLHRLAKLEERGDAEDVLLRFAAGQDRSDKALFASSFHEQAVLDFVQPAARFGVTLRPFSGKQTIVETVFQNIAPLMTSHTVTNQRLDVGEDFASGTALVEAEHVLRQEPSRTLLLKNFYDYELTRTNSGWAMERLIIRTIWHDGDPSVLFP